MIGYTRASWPAGYFLGILLLIVGSVVLAPVFALVFFLFGLLVHLAPFLIVGFIAFYIWTDEDNKKQ